MKFIIVRIPNIFWDTSIEKRVFDSVKFNLPAGVKSIKITHVTDAFKNGEFTAELFCTKILNPRIIKQSLIFLPGLKMKRISPES